MARAKALLDAGNTCEETARRLEAAPESSDLPTVVQSITELPVSVPAIVLEGYREALASKGQTTAALESTVDALRSTTAAQQVLIEELRSRPVAMPATVAAQSSTLRQWIDDTGLGRMLRGTREERSPEPEGPTKRSLPAQEPA